MNPKFVAMGVAVVAGLILVGLDVPRVATVETRTGLSYLAKLPDAGRAYMAEYRTSDGGREWLRVLQSDTAMCARRKLGGSSLTCRRGPSTVVNDAVPELNRFPASEAQPLANDCEIVACAVFYGEDPNLDEAALLNSTLGVVLP